MTARPPANLASLRDRLHKLAMRQDLEFGQLQRAVANVVVGQMLSHGVIKGGAAIRIRVGGHASRFTTDLDAARRGNFTLQDFLDVFQADLSTGWGGFSGTLEEPRPLNAQQVPSVYVTYRSRVKLQYLGRHWLSISFEVGNDEVGSTAVPELCMAADLIDAFEFLGLVTPSPVAVMPLNHQIAQKLHACTDIWPGGQGNQRAHDLVDLQILAEFGPIDRAKLRSVCERLFVSRKRHSWPPYVVNQPGWEELYRQAASGLAVLSTVEAAIQWVNAFVADIDAAG